MRVSSALFLAAGLVLAQPKLTPLNEASFPKMVAAHKGKIVLVDFWEMPQLVKLADRLRARGLDVVTVSADEPAKELAASKVLAENSVVPPVYLAKVAEDDKDKFYNSIDKKWSGEMPAMFIYDRSGKLVRSFLGETPVKDIEAAIQKLL
jgi:hypothetical protein